MSNQCKDCPDREIGCHGRCEKYAEMKAKRAEVNERRIKEYELKNALYKIRESKRKK